MVNITGTTYRTIMFGLPCAASILLLALASPFDWRPAPIYFLILNFLEYVLHRFPMHNRYGPGNWLWEHVTIHHHAYDDHHGPPDNKAVILPPYVLALFTVIIITMSAPISLFTGVHAALFFAACAFIYYTAYELLHYAFHLNVRWRTIRWMAQHHIDHHAKWSGNYNIAFPIFDAIFGTKLKRRE